jgi:hypothetical protein
MAAAKPSAFQKLRFVLRKQEVSFMLTAEFFDPTMELRRLREQRHSMKR